jgi:hypothetical protein
MQMHRSSFIVHHSLSTLFFLYFLHLWLRYIHFPLPTWLNNYWSDVLCLPIILTLMVFVIRRLQQKSTLLLELKHIFVVWAYISIVFEWFLPMVSTKFRGDVGDVVAYSVGAVVFYCFQKVFCTGV